MESTFSKSDIKKWLKRSGKTRQWLADELKVKKTTVDNWFNRDRPIPEVKQAIIRQLMNDSEKPCKYDDIRAFVVRLTPAEYLQLCEAAGARNLSGDEVENYVRDLLQRTWDTLAATVPDVVEEPAPPRATMPTYAPPMEPFA